MRVLLTGNRGYIGTVMGPMLSAAGHEVVGLDTDFYAACTFVGSVPEIPDDPPRSARSDPGGPRGLRRRRPPGRPLERSSRRPQPGSDPCDQSPRLRASRPRREDGGRSALPVLLLLQQLRRRGRCHGRRDVAAPARSRPYGESKVRAEEGIAALADDSLQPDVSAPDHGLRRLPPAALRHRPEQPRRPGR